MPAPQLSMTDASTARPTIGSIPPAVSFVIVNYKCSDKVATAVRSIQAHAGMPVQTVVVDNSNDNAEFTRLSQALAAFDCLLINASGNRGFGAGCNLGAAHAESEFLFFLNPDAQLKPQSLMRMLDTLNSAREVGAVGCLVMNEGNAIEPSHGEFIGLSRPRKWCQHVLLAALMHRWQPANRSRSLAAKVPAAPYKTDYVTGAAFVMRTADFRALNGYDETFFMYAEETDLQYRLLTQLNKHVMFDPRAAVFHERGGTFSVKIERRCLLEEGCLRFVRKHRGSTYARVYKGLTLTAIALELLAYPLYREHTFSDNIQLLKCMAKA